MLLLESFSGEPIGVLDYIAWEHYYKLCDEGRFKLTLRGIDKRIQRTNRIKFNTGYVGIVDKLSYEPKENRTIVEGHDGVGLLKYRIVAYYHGEESGTTSAAINDYTDNIMKALVRNNFLTNNDFAGAPLTPNRIMPQMIIDNDKSEGTILTLDYAWENCLTALNKIWKLTTDINNPVIFNVVPQKNGEWFFYTTKPDKAPFEIYIRQDEPTVEDGEEYVNRVYIGGPGREEFRDITKLVLTQAYDGIGLREGFTTSEANNADTQAADGRAFLRENKLITGFTTRTLDTNINLRPGTRIKTVTNNPRFITEGLVTGLYQNSDGVRRVTFSLDGD